MDFNKSLKLIYNMILNRRKKAIDIMNVGNVKESYVVELTNIDSSLNCLLAVMNEKGIEHTQSDILNGFKFEKTVKEAS